MFSVWVLGCRALQVSWAYVEVFYRDLWFYWFKGLRNVMPSRQACAH